MNMKWLLVPALAVVAACGRSSPSSIDRTSVELASGSPYGIAVDSTSAYWTNSGGGVATSGDDAVMKVPLGGGTPVMLASRSYSALGPREALGIAVDATSVYWSSDIQQGMVATGAVMKVTPK